MQVLFPKAEDEVKNTESRPYGRPFGICPKDNIEYSFIFFLLRVKI